MLSGYLLLHARPKPDCSAPKHSSRYFPQDLGPLLASSPSDLGSWASSHCQCLSMLTVRHIRGTQSQWTMFLLRYLSSFSPELHGVCQPGAARGTEAAHPRSPVPLCRFVILSVVLFGLVYNPHEACSLNLVDHGRGYLGILLSCMIAEMAIIWLSMRGGILYTEPRDSMQYVLYVRLGKGLLWGAETFLGLHVLFLHSFTPSGFGCKHKLRAKP